MTNDFDQVLEACLDDLKEGVSTLDECLARHPQHAAQLWPLLKTASRFERTREIRPSAAFKAQTRAKLLQHAQATPRARRRSLSIFQMSPQKLAVSFVVALCTFLIAGTAYAQSALPGSSFYSWKYTSERVWRAVSLDPVSTDIRFLNRRAGEWIAVSNDPDLSSKAFERYREAEDMLKSAVNENTAPQILPVLEKNHKLLMESGISVPLQNDSINLEIPGSSNNNNQNNDGE